MDYNENCKIIHLDETEQSVFDGSCQLYMDCAYVFASDTNTSVIGEPYCRARFYLKSIKNITINLRKGCKTVTVQNS